ncbi:Membrane-associated phosphatidylinositol transfer protein 2 [Balamuthia mandrillaris]
MVLLKEYRVPLPCTLEEFRLANRYCTMKRSEEETQGDAGVEVLKDEPFQNEELGSGRYTEKIIHLGHHVPSWARRIIPSKAQMLVEKSWNSFPRCKTIYSCPFFEKFSMTVISNHTEDNGSHDNSLELDASTLKKREVQAIDVAFTPLDKKYYKKEEDPTLWQSKKKGRGPLQNKWQESQPIMCCYKFVSVEFRYTGFQKRIEKYMQQMMFDLVFTYCRQLVCLMDEWAELSEEDIEAYEREVAERLNKKCAGLVSKAPVGPVEAMDVPECPSPAPEHQETNGNSKGKEKEEQEE